MDGSGRKIMNKFGARVPAASPKDKHRARGLARRDFLKQAAAVAGAALYSLPLVSSAQARGRALQKILDDSVAAARVPFAVGMTGRASGVTFAGASGDA